MKNAHLFTLLLCSVIIILTACQKKTSDPESSIQEPSPAEAIAKLEREMDEMDTEMRMLYDSMQPIRDKGVNTSMEDKIKLEQLLKKSDDIKWEYNNKLVQLTRLRLQNEQ